MTGVSSLSADVRWESVAEENGILRGYKVYWGTSSDALQNVNTTGPEATKYVIENLEAQTTYYFKVSFDLPA